MIVFNNFFDLFDSNLLQISVSLKLYTIFLFTNFRQILGQIFNISLLFWQHTVIDLEVG